jgi:hypothetical protein
LFEEVVAGSFLPVTVDVDVVVVTGGVLVDEPLEELGVELVFATGGPFVGLSSVTTVFVGASDEPLPGLGT